MASKKIALWSLIFTIVGVAVAILALAGGHSPATPQSAQIAQSSNVVAPQPDCSALGTEGGNVTINCDKSIHTNGAPKAFDHFEGGLGDDNIAKFSEFLDGHDGKIVKLSLRMDFPHDGHKSSWNTDDSYPGLARLIVNYNPSCDGSPDADCTSGTEYVFVPVKDGDPAYYMCNGAYCVDGYFRVDPQQGMHQGVVSTGVVRIPDAQAMMADDKSR